jgi:hypothetical protein
VIPTQPNIDLFSDGGVKPPLQVIREEFWIVLWVAVKPAEFVGVFVLVLEMPRINAHADSIEPRVADGLLFGNTAAIVHDVIGLLCTRNGHGFFDEYLINGGQSTRQKST